jgi:hypothetical protein
MNEQSNSPELNTINKNNLDLFLDKIGKLTEIDEIIDLIASHYQADQIAEMRVEANRFRENIISFFNKSLLSALHLSFRSLPDFSLEDLPVFIQELNSPETKDALLAVDQKFSGAEETFWSQVETNFEGFLVPLRALKQ